MTIGTLEARESVRELADLSHALRPSPNGAGFTTLGTLASAAVFLSLGAWLARDREALRLGTIVGALAGMIGGAIRADLASDAVRDAVAHYADAPDWFVPLVLVVFVGSCAVVTTVAGAALAFAGVRLSRAASRRPPA